MKNKGTTMLTSIEAVHFLVREYYPQDVPLPIRASVAFEEVEELFGEPVPSYLSEGIHSMVSEEGLIEWVSDYAFRPLGGGSWVLVDLSDSDSPCAIITPTAA